MEWIKCSDMLPEKMGSVLIYGRYAADCPKSVFEALYNPKAKAFRTDIKAKDVTHWQPLPPPPTK